MTSLPVAALLVALTSQTPTSAQARDTARPPLVGTAVIGGIVTADEPGGAPVRQAVVRINMDDGSNSGPAVSRAAVTDDRGRFVFSSLPPGRFYLVIDKGGWVSQRYGAQTLYDSPVPIAASESQPTNLNIKLARGAVIAGRVTDEYGQPQTSVRPVLLQYRTVNGQ